MANGAGHGMLRHSFQDYLNQADTFQEDDWHLGTFCAPDFQHQIQHQLLPPPVLSSEYSAFSSLTYPYASLGSGHGHGHGHAYSVPSSMSFSTQSHVSGPTGPTFGTVENRTPHFQPSVTVHHNFRARQHSPTSANSSDLSVNSLPHTTQSGSYFPTLAETASPYAPYAPYAPSPQHDLVEQINQPQASDSWSPHTGTGSYLDGISADLVIPSQQFPSVSENQSCSRYSVGLQQERLALATPSTPPLDRWTPLVNMPPVQRPSSSGSRGTRVQPPRGSNRRGPVPDPAAVIDLVSDDEAPPRDSSAGRRGSAISNAASPRGHHHNTRLSVALPESPVSAPPPTTPRQGPRAQRNSQQPAPRRTPARKTAEKRRREGSGEKINEEDMKGDDQKVADLVVDLTNVEEAKDLPRPGSPKKNVFKLAAFECVICMKQVKDLTITYCGHLFCSECLHQALHMDKAKRVCPICRQKIEHRLLNGKWAQKAKGFYPLELKLMSKSKTGKRAGV